MLLLLFHVSSVVPGPDSDQWERYIRPQFADSTVSSNLLIDNTAASSVTSTLGPLLPASAVSSDPR